MSSKDRITIEQRLTRLEDRVTILIFLIGFDLMLQIPQIGNAIRSFLMRI